MSHDSIQGNFTSLISICCYQYKDNYHKNH